MLHPDLLRRIDTTAPFVYRAQCEITSLSSDATSAPATIIIQDRSFICTRARVTGFYLSAAKAKRIIPTDGAMDLTRIHWRLSGGQRDLVQEPIDIQAFNEAYADDTFPGIIFPARSEIIVTIHNQIITGTNYAAPVKFDIALFGFQALSSGQ